MTTIQQPLPPPSWPIVGPNGVLDLVWYRVIQALYNRTGGAIGEAAMPVVIDLTAIKAAISDITMKQIPALQQLIDDQTVLGLVSDDAVAGAAVSFQAMADDLRVLALTQEP